MQLLPSIAKHVRRIPHRNARKASNGAILLSIALVLLPHVAARAQGGDSGAALAKLFEDSDQAYLRRNPFEALSRGDPRYADRLGYNLSDEYFDAERAAARLDLERLQRVDRAALSLPEQIEYDAFKWERSIALRALEPRYLDLTKVLAIESFTGFHLDYADLASGNGVATFNTVADYRNNLARHHAYARFIDTVIARLKEGVRRGTVQPKLIVEKTIRQLDVQLADGGDSIFNWPVHHFPDGFPESQRAALVKEYIGVTRETLVPALQRLRDYLQTSYLPQARASLGLSQMKGGAALYELLIEQNTTLSLRPDTLHRKGLAEVARIQEQMRVIAREVGFSGTLQDFFERVRTDPALRAGSPADIQRDFEGIKQRILAHLPEQFSHPPLDPLEIRAQPSYKDDTTTPRSTGASGYYQPGSPDGTRPGMFFYTVGTTPEMDSLFLHEAIPGHHLQGSIAQDNKTLPAFLRFDGPPAYVEGWALYAETLWDKLGVETDPFRRFGGLNAEMARAIRMVVDTGIHAYGWSREQAIRYMLQNSGVGRAEAESAVDRYVATPGQALAYKVGELAILDLKARAQAQRKERFDPRAFHQQILDTGDLPLSVLKEKIELWLNSPARPSR